VRELTTTVLDAVGLLLVAAGVAGGAWTYVGAWALCLGGVVVLVGSLLGSRGEPS
jgi:hypothetical protein